MKLPERVCAFAAAVLWCGGCLSVSETETLTTEDAAKRIPDAVIESRSAELLSRAAGEYFSGRDQAMHSDLAAAVRSDPVGSAELARMMLQKASDTLAIAFPPQGNSPTEYVRARCRTRIGCSLRIAIAEYHYLSHLISPTPEQNDRLLCVRLELAQTLNRSIDDLPELLPDGVDPALPPLPPLSPRWKMKDSDETAAALALAGAMQKMPTELNRIRAYDSTRDLQNEVRQALALAALFRLRLDHFALSSLALRETDGETLFLFRKFQAYEKCDRAELAEYGIPEEKKSLVLDLLQLQKPR